MLQKIEAFQLVDGDWVAQLNCGHTQHVRHRPPMESRPWVTSEDGRSKKLGAELDCLFCNMPKLPAGAQVYKQTSVFTEETVPKGLLKDHKTKLGTWGRIQVQEGLLLYQIKEPAPQAWTLKPGVAGIIEPGMFHCVRPVGEVRFLVEFLRVEAPG